MTTDSPGPDQTPPPDGPPAPAPPPVHSRWLFLAIMTSVAFFIPVFMLMRPAAEPSARASHAARHGFVQMDNEEGALLFQAIQISRGESIYHPLDEPPYVAGTYTPLYMATVAALDDFEHPNFSLGRMLVWISALGTGILLVLMVAGITRNIVLGVLAGFLFLATWEVYRWIGYFRVDFPAIFLSLAGVATITFGSRRQLGLALGALLMTLAIYTKQTAITAPAACFLALLLTRPRRAAAFVGWMLLWGVPALIALQWATGGQFLRHTIVYNMNTWDSETVAIWMRHVRVMHPWFFTAMLASLPLLAWMSWIHLRDAWRGDDGSAPDRPVILHGFWLAAVAYGILSQWNLIGVGKAGSAENYLLEPIAGWALLIAISAGAALRLAADPDSRTAVRVPTAALAIMVLALMVTHARSVSSPQWYAVKFDHTRNPGKADFEAGSMITDLMRKAENPLSELAIFHLLIDQPPVIQPFILSELARQGRWDQDAFVADIAAGKFDVVIALSDLTDTVDANTYTREMLDAFYRSYKVDRMIQTPLWRYYVLHPKSGRTTSSITNLVDAR